MRSHHDTEKMKGLDYDRVAVGDERSLFDKYRRLIIVGSLAILAYLVSTSHLFSWVSPTQTIPSPGPTSASCNTIEQGYQCSPEISHFWGQYSPYFSLEDQSTISAAVPEDCQVTFVQVLSRHGARYPTTSKTRTYSKLISKIQRHVTSFSGKYEFLKTYKYTLGANDLTTFGESQMVDSGLKFYERYQALSRNVIPFIRASDSDRVIVSGELFIQGFQNAKLNDNQSNQDQAAPVINVIIPESANFNNSLDHSICTSFEESKLATNIKNNFTELFATAIRERLENDLPGVNLSYKNIVHLMDMCSFDTVARTSDGSQLSPFCGLFTQKEWVQYDYLQSLAKYYGYGAGNPLGPAQGIGFANELIARMTQSPVQDHTNTNHTLDSDPATFPLNATIYIDFSHDNGITPILFALGLYNGTTPLSQTSVESIEVSDGYSASWTVPFGSRAYIEMMQCGAQEEPLVRALVNDRVVPLHGCSVDDLGRCRRDDFIRGLSFVRSGGNWDQCFL